MESEFAKSQTAPPEDVLVHIANMLKSIVEKSTFKHFRKPIDEVKDEAPGYYAVIKRPMDFKMMALKLNQKVYKKAIEVLADLMLICNNCKEYYKDPNCSVREKCAKLEEYVEKKWKKTAKLLKKDGIDLKNAGFNYSKLGTQPSLEQSISNLKEDSLKAPSSPKANNIPHKNSLFNDDDDKNQKAANINDQVEQIAKADKLEKSNKTKPEAKKISNKENFLEISDIPQNQYTSKNKEFSVFSEADSDKETSLTRKFSGFSQDAKPTKGFTLESESKESQKMQTQNMSTKPAKLLFKETKTEEEFNSPFDNSSERIIDNLDHDVSNSKLEIVESSNLSFKNRGQYFEDPILNRAQMDDNSKNLNIDGPNTVREMTPTKTEMMKELDLLDDNGNNCLKEEKRLVTPTQSREECLKRPELSPEKEKKDLMGSKVQDFNTHLLFSDKKSVEEKVVKIDQAAVMQVEEQKELKPIEIATENKVIPKPNVDHWDGMIRLDIVNIMKCYEEYAKTKIPKFIKKVQKYIKRLNQQIQTFDIQDEEFLKLKHEVEHLRLWNKSWNYSRILLYLYNIMTFFKCNHEINSQVFTKKDYKKTVSLAKKTFFYLREAIRVLCIKFTKEETEAFHKMRSDYRATLQNKVREYEEEELRKIQAIKQAELEKQKQLKREQKIQNKRQAQQLKRMKLEEEDDELYEGAMEVSEEEDEEYMEDLPKRKAKTAPKRNKRRLVRGPIIIKKKEAEENNYYDDLSDDMREELEVKKNLQACLNQLTTTYKSKEYLGSLGRQVVTSWKRGTFEERKLITNQNVQQTETFKRFKMEEEEIKLDTEEHKMMELPSNKDLISNISFNIPSYEEQFLPSKLSVFEDEAQSTCAEDQVSDVFCPPSFTSGTDKKYLAKIFQPEFAPDVIKIKQKLDIDFTDCTIDMNSKFEKKVTAIFFCNTIEKKLRGLLKLKGINYQFNLDHQDDETLSKLVLLRVELKQETNQDSEEENEEATCVATKELKTLKVHNDLTADSLNNFLTLSDKRAAHTFKLQNYDMLIQPWELNHKIEQISLIDRILNQVHQGPWKKQENCGVYYYAEPNVEYESESEYNYWDIGILTPVENFFSFHIELNDKLIF